MTKALEQVFREASKLPAAEQDALAEAIRNEIVAEEEWESSFAAYAINPAADGARPGDGQVWCAPAAGRGGRWTAGTDRG
ncbi:MAG: hypothetical protein L0177_11650 [Chloroflexi bacterium]|nr:hypothetical protein [Chloroflexota bacterium]